MKNHTVLYEKHFTQSDIVRPFSGTRRQLKQCAKPVLFEAWIANEPSKRKAPINRPSPGKKF